MPDIPGLARRRASLAADRTLIVSPAGVRKSGQSVNPNWRALCAGLASR